MPFGLTPAVDELEAVVPGEDEAVVELGAASGEDEAAVELGAASGEDAAVVGAEDALGELPVAVSSGFLPQLERAKSTTSPRQAV